MNKRKLLIYISTLITATSTLILTSPFSVWAQDKEKSETITRIDWKADEVLSKDAEQKYSLVDKVYLTGITTSNKQIRINTLSWVQGMYYFFSTKTQFKDIPFNYLVGWDGTIYEGKSSEKDLVAPIEDDSAILIGYLSNYDNAEMTHLGKEASKKLLNQLIPQYNLKQDDLQAKDWNIKPTDNLQKSFIEISKPESSQYIAASLDDIKSQLDYSVPLVVRNYKGDILSIDYDKNVRIGENYEVKLKVKNLGENNWYRNSPAEITIAKADGKSSGYQIAGEWLSESQTSAMTADTIKTDEEAELIFNIEGPFIAGGKHSEKFILKTKSGAEVEGTEFEIAVEVSNQGLQIAEVTETPTGYLNVRERPSISGELITQVLPGEKFILLESQSGWGKIRLKTGEEGWAAKQYLKDL